MKRTLFIVVSLVISNSLFAQKDVTKFMGIPIDGSKPEMIQKLKGKGFVSSASDKEVLEGEFNGTQVNVYVVTNNDKVCRIVLSDVTENGETGIKIRFNTLCRQFQNNSNYGCFGDQTIADDEDISYEMTAHDKRYEAIFYQKPLWSADSTEIANKVLESANVTEEDDSIEIADKVLGLANITEEDDSIEIADKLFKWASEWASEMIRKKPVWFMISEGLNGGYYINMYYDNEYNRANGEDL